MKRLGFWIAGLVGRSRFERELSDELAFHLHERSEHWRRQGLSPEQARRRARLEFGNVEHVKETVRETRFGGWFEEARQDVRHALRGFAHSPGLTIVVLVSLTLGIGIQTTAFSVVDAMMLQPLPYEDPDRLIDFSTRHYDDWLERTDLFESISFGGAYLDESFASEGYVTEQLPGMEVGTELFETLGIDPLIGRSFTPADATPEAGPTVILSHRTWQQRFDSSPEAIGQTIRLGGEPTRIIGVMPPDFDVFRSCGGNWRGANRWWTPQPADDRGREWKVIARLVPGATTAQVRALHEDDERQADGSVWEGFGPDEMRPTAASDRVERGLVVLWGAAGVVFLVACANAAGLLLVRSLSRRKDLALRIAIGASRWRVARLVVAEGTLLCFAGGALGAMLAVWCVRLIQSLSPDNNPLMFGPFQTMPRLEEASIDLRALGFTALVAVLAVLLTSLLPALRSSRLALEDALKESPGRGARSLLGGLGVGGALVTAQVAMALVLLSAAALLLNSLAGLWSVHMGLEAERVLTFAHTLPEEGYVREPASPDEPPVVMGDRVDVVLERLLDRLSGIPGVESVGGGDPLLLSHHWPVARWVVSGRPLPDGELYHGGGTFVRVVGDYFGTLGIEVLRGRAFTPADTADAPWVAIITERAAEEIWPGEDPIGQRLTIAGEMREPRPGEQERVVVGVVSDILNWGSHNEPDEIIFVPVAQQPVEALRRLRDPGQPWRLQRGLGMTFVVKTGGNPAQWAADVQQVVAEVDPDNAVTRLAPMTDVVALWTDGERFYAIIATVFAVVAIALAGVGIYGTLAYAVGKRTREIGIRVALGANRSGVVRLVARQGLAPVVAGIAFGLWGAYSLTHLLAAIPSGVTGRESILVGVSPTDPTTFAAVAALLLGVAVLACYRPARRATEVDPVITLRTE